MGFLPVILMGAYRCSTDRREVKKGVFSRKKTGIWVWALPSRPTAMTSRKNYVKKNGTKFCIQKSCVSPRGRCNVAFVSFFWQSQTHQWMNHASQKWMNESHQWRRAKGEDEDDQKRNKKGRTRTRTKQANANMLDERGRQSKIKRPHTHTHTRKHTQISSQTYGQASQTDITHLQKNGQKAEKLERGRRGGWSEKKRRYVETQEYTCVS